MKVELNNTGLSMLREFCHSFVFALFGQEKTVSIKQIDAVRELHASIVAAQNNCDTQIEISTNQFQEIIEAYKLTKNHLDRHINNYVEHIISSYGK